MEKKEFDELTKKEKIDLCNHYNKKYCHELSNLKKLFSRIIQEKDSLGFIFLCDMFGALSTATIDQLTMEKENDNRNKGLWNSKNIGSC